MSNKPKSPFQQGRSWRAVLPVHPLANQFPLMPPAELRATSEDIKTNGLQIPITVLVDKRGDEWIYQLLDGRNRLDAIELAGFDPISPPKYKGRAEFRREGRGCGLQLSLGLPLSLDLPSCIGFVSGLDEDEVRAFIISANIHRRHLTAEQRRDLIAELLKAAPEKSDRQIAEAVKASPTTVGTVRAEMEAKGEVSKLDTRTDARGVKQPSSKPRKPRNRARATNLRAMKLGDSTIDKLKGTSLGSAAEMDELVILNRGAPKGGHTKPVKQLVAAAVAGEDVSAIAYTDTGAAFRREDIGPTSNGEIARKDAEIEELRAEKRRLEITISQFQTAIKKWEDTVETQKNIIRDLQNENAKLRAKLEAAQEVAAASSEITTANIATVGDPGPFPTILLRKPKATGASDSRKEVLP
jgi:hypothetical protein